MRTRNDLLVGLTEKQLRRFWLKVDRTDGGCWEWRGAVHPNGYGTWTIGLGYDATGKQRHSSLRPHRVAWHEIRGPIPDGLVLDHLCRNTTCVNPDHLEVVDQAVNGSRIPSVDPAGQFETVVTAVLAAYSPDGVVKWWGEWLTADAKQRRRMESGVRAITGGLFAEAS